MIDCKSLVSENNGYLQQAIELLEKLDDDQYTNSDSPYYISAVGKHIRNLRRLQMNEIYDHLPDHLKNLVMCYPFSQALLALLQDAGTQLRQGICA